ncbi:MAG: cob(I)yrinic acid a,c-diamide adenosyltransferase [Opitutales bacterium]
MPGRIYTRTGDKGMTGVAGGGRVDKDDPRMAAMGDLDEANATLGYLRAKLPVDHDWQPGLHRIQKEWMDAMGHLAKPSDVDKPRHVPLPEESAKWAEEWMDAIEASLESATEYFLLPGGNEVSALCHMIRTQIRRAERSLVTLYKHDPGPQCILEYVNRLSDLFFKLARQEMARSSIEEDRWQLFRYNRKAGKGE